MLLLSKAITSQKLAYPAKLFLKTENHDFCPYKCKEVGHTLCAKIISEVSSSQKLKYLLKSSDKLIKP